MINPRSCTQVFTMEGFAEEDTGIFKRGPRQGFGLGTSPWEQGRHVGNKVRCFIYFFWGGGSGMNQLNYTKLDIIKIITFIKMYRKIAR